MVHHLWGTLQNHQMCCQADDHAGSLAVQSFQARKTKFSFGAFERTRLAPTVNHLVPNIRVLSHLNGD